MEHRRHTRFQRILSVMTGPNSPKRRSMPPSRLRDVWTLMCWPWRWRVLPNRQPLWSWRRHWTMRENTLKPA